ncbi:hypothetical protein CHS0354_040131 [Potamilus streckersoni]|uniref:RING-type domain-containing protein n=1 Tax=Potamilus streckersoni TaxID=2493646 RepID=A0AAE0ST28_9BIVA|nr:hypothetical protein CHS0354_040131 [Potamilus streckersoni]
MGYEVHWFIGSIDPNLLCGICNAVLEDAVLTPCGHSFCYACIETWLSRPSTVTCPECRANVTLTTVKPVLSLRNLINGFEVGCPNSKRGCKVIIKLDRVNYHLETCGYISVECAGCGTDVNRFELASHQMACEGIAASVKEEDYIIASERLTNLRFTTSMTSADVKELLSKLSSLEFELKTLKRDLQIAESKNRVLERECRKARDELLKARNELPDSSCDYDPEYKYGHTPQSIANLSLLIAKNLLRKPSFIDREMIFCAVRRCYDKYARCGTEYEHDIHMLIATAFASNWFSENQRHNLHYYLQSIARYRNMTNNLKYTANIHVLN